MRARVLELAHEFGLSDRDVGLPVEALGALKQHVVQIIKALAFKTRVLILDEPTSGLADHERLTLFTYMRQLRERGISLLWVTHRLDELFGLADTITVLRDGKFVANVDPVDETADSLVRLMVGRSNLAAREQLAQDLPRAGYAGNREEVLRLESISRLPAAPRHQPGRPPWRDSRSRRHRRRRSDGDRNGHPRRRPRRLRPDPAQVAAHEDPFPAGRCPQGHRVRARGTQDPRHPRRLLDQAEHHHLRPQARRHGRADPARWSGDREREEIRRPTWESRRARCTRRSAT